MTREGHRLRDAAVEVARLLGLPSPPPHEAEEPRA